MFVQLSFMLLSQTLQVVHFEDWLRIDKSERSHGEAEGRERVKFVDVSKMLSAAQ